jgi:molybdopterin synthase sulfur carrier subunit
MTAVTVLYFASLRDAAGVDSEALQTDAADLQALYLELQARHGLAMPLSRLRVAVDGAFASWQSPVHDGAEIAFIPPVSGG